VWDDKPGKMYDLFLAWACLEPRQWNRRDARPFDRSAPLLPSISMLSN